MDIKKTLSNVDVDTASIQDEKLRTLITRLLNAVEALSKESDELRKKNQQLTDENNRLKGEQGKPSIRPQTGNKDHSSESLRGKDTGDSDSGKTKNPKPKKDDIVTDRIERCDVDKSILPADAVFKGYETVVVQDIKITTNNVKFEVATYYSPSEKKTYRARLPKGYHGQFGPVIKSLVLDLYQNGGMTEPALKRFLNTHGAFISSGKISNIITQEVERFHVEKTDIVNAGLLATDYQHLDDTASRVNGKNHHTHILCNPLYTAYFTLPSRDRLAAIEVLMNGYLQFLLNEDAYALMSTLGLSEKRLIQLTSLQLPCELMTKESMDQIIRTLFPDEHRHPKNQQIIREAAALTAYAAFDKKISVLLTDGALQFQSITDHQSLCWVHEGRHYNKLSPLFLLHRNLLETFKHSFWDFYRQLQAYKKNPLEEESVRLSRLFDVLFSTKTGYEALDERIASTLEKKDRLLLALRLPHLPLHNNPAELGARVQARKRDISLQTKNTKGTRSKDTLMTIIETAKKLGVNTFNYFHDRLSGAYQMSSLADLIKNQSRLPIPSTG
jgi:hypothetical protein